ncbi:hypothetical protein ILUMI_19890 [Ignelater luminosus]|uniref:Uncharacterized protein n=1 Tax=Ignelater luminosus TaxID=2038154 RepID=A0A8K0CFB5_IGNLU|nr:hypothetical protein ILUMI_19890 [Ignelater luminosus]
MAELDIDWSKLPEDVREKLAELDLELSEEVVLKYRGMIPNASTVFFGTTSGHEINPDKFNEFTKATAELFVKRYGWYRMPVNFHKILVHRSQVIKSLLLPIGMLSEEAQEASNKNYNLPASK